MKIKYIAVFAGVGLIHAYLIPALGAAGTATIRTVAVAGEHAPDTAPNTNFRELGFANLNIHGQTAFRSELGGSAATSNDNWGIWSEGGGQLHLLARENQIAPGTTTRFSENLTTPLINSAGESFFWSLLTTGVKTGIWTERGQGLELVAVAGNPAPDIAPGGAVFESVDSGFAVNDDGIVAFLARVTGPGVTPTTRDGLWVGETGNLRLVARTGSPAPGTEAGTVFAPMNNGNVLSRTPGISPSAKVVFISRLSGPNLPPNAAEAIWVDDAGSLTLAIRSGVQPPNTSPGAFLSDFDDRDVVINDAGDVAVLTSVFGPGTDSSNRFGIWSKRDGQLDEVARMGSPVPGMGPGTVFNGIGEPVINRAGDVAFIGSAKPPTPGDVRGIWAEDNRELRTVARAGNPAPGAGAGVLFSSFDDVLFNDLGQIAFYATTSNNRGGIWAEDVFGNLQKIVLENDVIEIRPGDVRIVTDVQSDSLVGFSGNEDGRGNGFNSVGQIAFRIDVNGDTGIFVSDLVAVPEPSSWTIVLGSCALQSCRGRRRTNVLTKRESGV